MQKRFNDKILLDWTMKNALIARDGIYRYLGEEIGEANPADAKKVFYVYRDKSAVEGMYNRFKELGKIPVVFDHPQKGQTVGDDFSQGYAAEPELVKEGLRTYLKCKMFLDEKGEAYKAYQDGIRELSCGWDGEFNTADSNVYSYKQEFKDFDHIALVEQGRAGSECSILDRIFDSFNNGKEDSSIESDKEDKMEEVKMTDEEQKASYIKNLKDAMENLPEEHREGALESLAGLEKFLGAEAKEYDESPDEVKKPMEDEEEEVKDDPFGSAESSVPAEDNNIGFSKFDEDVMAESSRRLDEYADNEKDLQDVKPFITDGFRVYDISKGINIKKEILTHFGILDNAVVADAAVVRKEFKKFADSYTHQNWQSGTISDKALKDENSIIADINNIGLRG